jgi:hypothetical protein
MPERADHRLADHGRPIERLRHHRAILACGMSEPPQSFGQGSPLRPRNDPMGCHTRPQPYQAKRPPPEGGMTGER